MTREGLIKAAVDRLDVGALAERYREDDGLLVMKGLLPQTLITEMAAEAERLAPAARRSFVPFVRKGGAVGHYDIEAKAPALSALGRSPALHALARALTGHALVSRHPRDPHASGLYVYSRPGDHVGWHYDDCGCLPEASFTFIAGVVDEGSCALEVELYNKTPGRSPVRRLVATEPGTLVFFRGSSVHHRVTKLRRGERRISFSFIVLREGTEPKGFDRVYQTAIDTFLYFGPKGLPRDLSLWRDMLSR